MTELTAGRARVASCAAALELPRVGLTVGLVRRHPGTPAAAFAGGGGRSPGSELRSSCVKASTSSFLRHRLSTMVACMAAAGALAPAVATADAAVP